MARRGPKLANPLSITSAVREEVNFDLSVQDALARDYVNLSALARMLVPKVAKRTRKKVRVEGVITALKRLRGAYSPASHEIGKVIAGSVVNMRTHVSKVSVEKNRRTLQAVASMLTKHQEDFIQVSESLSAITLIFDQRLHKRVTRELSGGEILAEGDDLAAIIVQSPEKIVSTPGCVIAFYNQLSRRHVNMEDTVSCHTDTIMVVKVKDAGKAFEALTELIDEERKRVE
ncbi:MAG: ACT domain-containing protein [Nitrososphaerota archaeon]|nr:ACT domain-containing protein [Nitrososphaerota archaeon]